MLPKFREGSKNQRLAELLLDGAEHDRAELAQKAGAAVNAVPYVVKQLRLCGHDIERIVDDATGKVRYRVLQASSVSDSNGGGPGFQPRSLLGEDTLSVTIVSLQIDETATIRFTVAGWGAGFKRGVIHPESGTLHVASLTGTLEVREVLLLQDGSVGLRVGNEHGTIDIVDVHDER